MADDKGKVNYTIHKDIINLFQKQNPTGYFHLLYLIQEHRVLKQEDEMNRLRENMTELQQSHIGEMNDSKAKQRDIIKSATEKYDNMLGRHSKELKSAKKLDIKTEKQLEDQHVLIKTLQAECEVWKNKYDSETDVNINKVLVWKNKFDELAKSLEESNGKN